MQLRGVYLTSNHHKFNGGHNECEGSLEHFKTWKCGDVETYFTIQPGTPVRFTQSKQLRQYINAQPSPEHGAIW